MGDKSQDFAKLLALDRPAMAQAYGFRRYRAVNDERVARYDPTPVPRIGLANEDWGHASVRGIKTLNVSGSLRNASSSIAGVLICRAAS